MALRIRTLGMILALAVMGLVVSAVASLVVTRTLPSIGSIRISTPSAQLGIYSNSACTIQLSTVSWGTLSPGSKVTSTLYLKNEGNVPVTLSIQTVNWNPASAQSYLALTWNRGGYVLAVGASAQAVLSLAVSSSISNITSFSFDITIIGTQ